MRKLFWSLFISVACATYAFGGAGYYENIVASSLTVNQNVTNSNGGNLDLYSGNGYLLSDATGGIFISVVPQGGAWNYKNDDNTFTARISLNADNTTFYSSNLLSQVAISNNIVGINTNLAIQGITIPARGVASSLSDTPASVTVGASPFSFTNLTGINEECFITGSTAYSVTKKGAAMYGSLAGDCYVKLSPNSWLTITYTVAPTMTTNSW